MLNYPSRLSLAHLPTPLTRLERFSVPSSDTEIWIKHDEITGTEVSGNKIRKMEFCLAEARDQGCNTVITCGGIQSNHCRATAVLGARLGIKVHLLLRGEKPGVPEGNLLMDYLAGAEITFIPTEKWYGHADYAAELQADYVKKGDKALFIPVGASDEIGLWGYIAACEELRSDFERLKLTPDYIVTATGSGGTQGGLIVGAQIYDLKTKVKAFNVSDDAKYFDQKIREDVSLWKQRYNVDFDDSGLEIDTIEGYLGSGYGVAGQAVFELIAELARNEGIFLDPVYTGKAFHGMVSELAKGHAGQLSGAKQVVFIHTGGLFGVFPQQEGFRFD
ncbi:MAG TPA: D-cysteine desulfhydrase family protein [Gammaproteobacteria bacterium]|nr:D-cysteine desulfhydrase family protein [Gammaproteobacteria bacterium]HCI87472.1 D-cysteine desulfhydrase family protein [Gammaproteobacteria bacterium]|tara:strand:+ start:2056 stop:3054 length:999 start_codon:yes stop_codon:yes gene_type:complete